MEFSVPATGSSGSVDGSFSQSIKLLFFGEGGARGLWLEEGTTSGLNKTERSFGFQVWVSSLGKIKCLGPEPWAFGRLLSDK